MALVQNADKAIEFPDFIGAFTDCFRACYIYNLLVLCQYFMVDRAQWLRNKRFLQRSGLWNSPVRILTFPKGGFHHAIVFNPKKAYFHR